MSITAIAQIGMFLLRNWKYAAMLGLGAVVAWQAFLLGVKDSRIDNLETKVSLMADEVEKARAAVALARDVNEGNLSELARIRADSDAAVAALSRELEATKRQKEQVRVVRQVVRERVEVCPPSPVPPGIGAALDWLRSNPDSTYRPDQDRARPAARP